MPTYEYACKACGERLEVVQKFSDDPLHECPACGGQLRKVFQAVGIAFKGSGFYKTDSRAGASARQTAGDGAKEPSGDGAKETKKESTKSEPAKAGSSSGSDSSSGTAKTA